MKMYEKDGFYFLEMQYAKIASKNKSFINEEYQLRKEKCYCTHSEKCGYCSGVENPRKKN